MRLHPAHRQPRWSLARIIAIGLSVALLAGMAYVRISEWRDRQRFPQVGQSINIGGRALNIFCSGTGAPTVVFESGYGFPGYHWRTVQSQVEQTTRACWYDRAGNGWSDPAAGQRFSDSVAHDLHALLIAAQVPPPYVLIGHSLGAFHARVFNALYPREVAGLVLVDPSNEEMATKIPDMPRARPPAVPPAVVHAVDEILRQIGMWRFMTRNLGPRPQQVTSTDWEIISSLRRNMKAQRAAANEAPESGSAEIARAAAGLDSVRLIVLTRGNRFPFPDSAYGNRMLERWIALSGELAARSTRGRQIVVPGAGHFIQLDRPDVVSSTIHEMVDSVRASSLATHEGYTLRKY